MAKRAQTPTTSTSATDRPTSSIAAWWADFSGFWLRSVPQRRLLVGLLMSLWLLIFANQWLHVNKDIARPQRFLGVQSETIYVPPVAALRLASLGHQRFVADLLFVRVAHYFVDHLLSDSQMPFIDIYLNAIWGLDAQNRTTYRWGAQVIKFGQQIDEKVNDRANYFARLGLEEFPHDGWLYHEIAYNLFAYRSRYDAMEGARRERLALQYLGLAYQMPGFSFDPNYLAHQYARAGRMEDSVGAAMASYAAGTVEQRRELRVRLRQRDRSVAATTLGWLDHGRRRDWPHLDETLSMVVGPRRVAAPPIDGNYVENWLPEREVQANLLNELRISEIKAPRAALDGGVKVGDDEEFVAVGRISPRAPAVAKAPLRNVFMPGPATTTSASPATPPADAPTAQETP